MRLTDYEAKKRATEALALGYFGGQQSQESLMDAIANAIKQAYEDGYEYGYELGSDRRGDRED